jgi:hypothetical protein
MTGQGFTQWFPLDVCEEHSYILLKDRRDKSEFTSKILFQSYIRICTRFIILLRMLRMFMYI